MNQLPDEQIYYLTAEPINQLTDKQINQFRVAKLQK